MILFVVYYYYYYYTVSVTTVKTSKLRAFQQIIIKMRFEEMDFEATERVNLAYVRGKLRVIVKTIMNLWFP